MATNHEVGGSSPPGQDKQYKTESGFQIGEPFFIGGVQI